MNLFSYWMPTAFAPSITTVSADYLRHSRIDTVLLDIDNTIIDPFLDELEPSMIAFLHSWMAAGIHIVITSNSNHQRVRYIADQLKVPYLYHTGKPMIRRFQKFQQAQGMNLTHAVVIGDQLLTDAWFAHRLKVPAIIVEPLVPHDLVKTRPNRFIDRLIRHHYRQTNRYLTCEHIQTLEVKTHE